jgi:hypothetical protein
MSATFTQQPTAEFGRPLLKVWNFADRIFKFVQWIVFTAGMAFAAHKTGSAALFLLTMLLLVPVLALVFTPVFIVVFRKARAVRGGGLAPNLKAAGWLMVGMLGLLVTSWAWTGVMSVYNVLATGGLGCK